MQNRMSIPLSDAQRLSHRDYDEQVHYEIHIWHSSGMMSRSITKFTYDTRLAYC